MTEDSLKVLVEALVKLVFTLTWSLVVKPLALIYALNLLLAELGHTVFAYNWSTYAGALLLLLAITSTVSTKD